MIAEMQRTEMVDGLLNSIAIADNEYANGIGSERTGATERSCDIHRFCFELSRLSGG
jgi:hypothetical protein